ncbi:MAG TPA: permease prefix domain 1-containing protein [Bacillota bacterium]|nr:permease prefix domain 1-containing protein [Bacillota bacterium]
MNNIKKFVTRLLKDFFNEQDKKELVDILTTSLEEKIEDLVEQGIPREEAVEKSIKEFGNADDVLEAFPEYQKNLENVVRKRRNQLIFSTLAYFIISGLVTYLNFQVSPNVLWFVFIAIGLLFWPLVMLYLYLSVRR